MRTFKSVRPLEEVKKLMLEQGYFIPSKSQKAYNDGSDWILFCRPERRIQYRPHDGSFALINSVGYVIATHLSEEFEDREDYQELLNIFYISE